MQFYRSVPTHTWYEGLDCNRQKPELSVCHDWISRRLGINCSAGFYERNRYWVFAPVKLLNPSRKPSTVSSPTSWWREWKGMLTPTAITRLRPVSYIPMYARMLSNRVVGHRFLSCRGTMSGCWWGFGRCCRWQLGVSKPSPSSFFVQGRPWWGSVMSMRFNLTLWVVIQ